ncbi:hypothetical protein WALSEDRAFT_68948 [Wallemia mellicola CBS 633.66]|uniref:Protein N-terminal glutamine amidohydrolase n=1 Tax=Wallemia mellicola (strain ATCC MYA-4683 / CBS 633.66) TaxID=671144 RepID=I4YCK3_WALMC|nr:hypothetical protein WALSEDRAFT_68948 [Wallemia mellicola CBS 633.66]EIM21695.1 hypothetical protein WALSEDRAFT_68948 [Wallemia mellicola CBS 633.66]|eukprot:XP_006958381.1 hypothetical protein WALSEDRAFT_68948 [Wallemia mellicola CBS 633.66]
MTMKNIITVILEYAESAEYQSCYCEENIYRLVKKLADAGVQRNNRVAFISNTKKHVLLCQQNASSRGDPYPVIWDYHVIALFSLDDGDYVLDLDTRLGRLCRLDEYIQSTFHSSTSKELRAWLHVVDAETFIASFASDRRHMIVDGQYLSPPPSWAPIRGKMSNTEHNLEEFIEGSFQPASRVALDWSGSKTKISL